MDIDLSHNNMPKRPQSCLLGYMHEHENVQAGIDSVSKGSLYAMGIVSGVIGLWAALYFLTAMMSNGPVNLLKNWISAIAGI